jgi:hypothetical protein
VKRKEVLQFRIALQTVEPEVWRRILIPSSRGTFWSLHCAIQDSLGWLDYHLHEFFAPVNGQMARIGIPDEDGWDTDVVLPSWQVRLARSLTTEGQSVLYIYDFGDAWHHTITFEGTERRLPDRLYPVCLGGARACPPEDCGGPGGYAHFLEAIQNKRHPDHRSLLRWVGGSFDPERFDANSIEFTRPAQRLRRAGLGGAA